MRKNMPQGNPISEQHARKPGQNPSDIDQDRGSFEPGSRKPGGDGQKQAPKPEDPKRPATKPQGTTDDQITNMESEGQAQEPVDPQEPEQKPARRR